MDNIAVIGAGISGLTAAYYLSRRYRVTVFEANTAPGGHADTQDIMIDGKRLSVDTGFIVFNDRTYPNFIRLLNELDCRYQPTEMSFSVKHSARNLEYNGHNLNTLFAQRRNLLRPSFLGMIKDVLRFNLEAPSVCPDDPRSLGEYLHDNRYGERFQQDYLLPMAAAIWSTGSDAIKQFPVVALIRFFHHHGLIQLRDRPRWRVIRGGSRHYVNLIRARLKDVRTRSTVTGITRHDDHVTIETGGDKHNFDQVVIATHSDQALAMLTDPVQAEREILGNITYTENRVKLHTDASVMPVERRAWASWNYNLDGASEKASLTYYMNRLQHLDTRTPILVTLNDEGQVDDDKVIREVTYHHPFFDAAALAAQSRREEISGMRRTHYAGAWWGNGFHEDGVSSALHVCKALGIQPC